MTRAEKRRTRTLVTPEGLELDLRLASRGTRLGALLIDLLIVNLGLVLFILALIWLLGSLAMLDTIENTGAGEFLIVILTLGVFGVRYFYFLGQELGPRGATWGKRLMKIRIASRDGGRLSAEAVIARNLLRELELFMPIAIGFTGLLGEGGLAGLLAGGWFILFMALPIFNADRLRAGDIVAGTWVVEAPRSRLEDAMSLARAAAMTGRSEETGTQYRFGDAELSVYGEYELQTLERVLRRDDPEARIEVAQAIARKIGWDPGEGDETAFLEAFYAQLRARLERGMQMGQRKADKFS
jgi:uncharacterized RDD family membrane protein YckC